MGICIYLGEMVECNGVLFWSKCPIGIVACSIQDDSFIEVRIAEFSFDHIIGDNDYRSFMVAYGSLVLVVIVVFDDLLQSANIVILELFQDKEDPLFWKWRLFARISPPSIPQYFEINHGSSWQLECACAGDYLCFSSVEGIVCPKIAAYNLREGFWQCLPQCPGTNFSKMMSFEPKLIV
ncbi:hypothetical protein SUGI_0817930 [Cryptomeria japonica]|nr:hypothetical protein SUGI_0817930 [Cryptomeria japonica]